MQVREPMIRRGLALVAMMMVVFAAVGADARTAVTGVRLGAHPDGVTRFVMDLSDQLDFAVSTQAGPDRIVVSTNDLDWGGAVARPFGSVGGLRFESAGGNGRIVLDLKEAATVKSAFVIPPRDGQGWRFVMDLQQATRAAFLAEAKPAARIAAPATAKPQPVAAKPALPEPIPAKTPDLSPVKAAPVAPPPAAAAETPARMVFYSPEVTPPAAPPPVPAGPSAAVPAGPSAAVPAGPSAAVPAGPSAAVPAVVKPEPKPVPTVKVGASVMTAPVPPPLERPVLAAAPVQAVPAPVQVAATPPVLPAKVAVPPPAPVSPAVTKAAAPLPVPDPEPKGVPTDGKPVIVIDPGHGGVDPGAIGVSGIYEKYITLAVARDLKANLEKGGRYKVYLTRDRDVFIRLRERVAIGRQHGADLFVSLHADSVGNPQLKGLSVYTLSQNASDSEAQALADKENKADLIAGIDLSHESADVANILIDLAQRETMNRSAVFAGGMVEEVGRETQLLGNTHRFAGFAVLKAPDVPSVLVELGYLSNDTEERNLRQPEYRARLAKAISRSIDRFFLSGQKAKRP
jgi:N-acetylmuramoyl-L-alanine amidase